VSTLDTFARRWWGGELGARGRLLHAALAPAEALYAAGVLARDQAYGRGLVEVRRASVPVISVGNVAVGGTGKTPLAHWIAVHLQQAGHRPAVLHGGYADDEPELHRRWSPDIPVIVERDRVAGAERAVAAGADILILDDGFQHRRLARELDIVLVSAERWDSSPHLLPRGPWREPVGALRRADLVLITRKAAPAALAAKAAADVRAVTGRQPLQAHLRPAGWRDRSGPSGPPTGAAMLVCGLAEPELFRDSAEQAGADVAGFMVFPDHHRYTRGDADRILSEARGRTVVTTEKDWTKLQPLLDGVPIRLLVQEVVIEEGRDSLEAALRQAASRRDT
jgi:tetraacyldisaccharide 4'-kinase